MELRRSIRFILLVALAYLAAIDLWQSWAIGQLAKNNTACMEYLDVLGKLKFGH